MRIPFSTANIFQWYSGIDPDRYTIFCGENLNLPINQVLENTISLDTAIEDILNGNIKANLLYSDRITSREYNIDESKLSIVGDYLRLEKDTVLHNFELNKIKVNKVEFTSLYIKETDNKEIGVYDYDNELASFKMSYINVEKINSGDLNISFAAEGDDTQEGIFSLNFQEDNTKSLLELGTLQVKDACVSFSSSSDARRDDAIVYNDANDGTAPNSYLFYSDGSVKNSTLVAGDIKTIGADLAEFYDSDKDYEVGTVLAIGGDREVTEYKAGMKVAGIISTTPGQILNEANTFKYEVCIGLTGRLNVKIDGSAKKGDYIIALDNGVGVAKSDINFEDSKNILGIALEDAEDNILIKV
jgi:hypothetical protein